jgi:hypothetical protein
MGSIDNALAEISKHFDMIPLIPSKEEGFNLLMAVQIDPCNMSA